MRYFLFASTLVYVTLAIYWKKDTCLDWTIRISLGIFSLWAWSLLYFSFRK